MQHNPGVWASSVEANFLLHTDILFLQTQMVHLQLRDHVHLYRVKHSRLNTVDL